MCRVVNDSFCSDEYVRTHDLSSTYYQHIMSSNHIFVGVGLLHTSLGTILYIRLCQANLPVFEKDRSTTGLMNKSHASDR